MWGVGTENPHNLSRPAFFHPGGIFIPEGFPEGAKPQF